MTSNDIGRGAWGSRLGFILAAAGSAIGLGNIWGFPYMAAQNGGGAFVLLYLVCVVFIGVPVLLAELSIGRASQKSPVGAFSGWLPGASGLASAPWASSRASRSYRSTPSSPGGRWISSQGAPGGVLFRPQHPGERVSLPAVSAPYGVALWTGIFFVLTMLVVRGGIRGGIERASKILMPAFFVLLAGLALRSVTLPGAEAGVRFLFDLTPRRSHPRWSFRLSPRPCSA